MATSMNMNLNCIQKYDIYKKWVILCMESFYSLLACHQDFPDSSACKESPTVQKTLVGFLGGKDPLEKG